ncbi:hypothetical protein PENANT_c026G11620 [Penicillium antarcticum]|uniref:Uncharacterized protein n=1 Tax=Penicillium antarcticum TaxID=416450 RepID=A0A1V6PY07_9EURO|nr:uncharacterized protein N7508_000042 [Penicillium antarcticum]KAJ5319759.1 hypothetical protein N7508_000042 [Penicillium antarcticum]OQD81637.1 hypothetical protein PENANT_c026G11620 [Penicillium antarcticum]
MTTNTTTTNFDVKEQVHSSTLSVASCSTLCTLHESTSFQPSRILTVNAQGIAAFRLPLPSRQMKIVIYNTDGSEAYVSTRDKRWSGDAVLSHPNRGDIIRTEYFFGPNRDPVLHILQAADLPSVTVTGKWTSRAARFEMPGGKCLEWEYAKEKRPDGQKVNLLVLNAIAEKADSQEHIRLAQLVRGSDSRTPGTSRCTAGNGGELQIDEAALQSLGLDEALIAATCLMMLKKEIDRRRMIQMAVIGGAGS